MQGQALRWRRGGRRVVLVPTMGALHAGHESLLRRARHLAGQGGVVVASIFVNPLQFNNAHDLACYPRPTKSDRAVCQGAGVDVLFMPGTGAMRKADASTWVEETALAAGMEGAARPGHFRGVTTVVAQLLNLVLPDVAVFGEKDYQQAAVVRRMVRDLHFPVRLVVAPTVREPSGLAMSSRNAHLSAAERSRASALVRALQAARKAARSAAGVSGGGLSRLKRRLVAQMGQDARAQVEYLEFFDPQTLKPVRRLVRGARAAVAARVGRTRLIDNVGL